MNKSFQLLPAFLLFLLPLGALAEEMTAEDGSIWQKSPIIELQPGKKVLKVADLGISDNMSLEDLLCMFPELMNRSGGEILKFFDLQINDVSAGSNKASFLEQLKALDIKTIELSVNPTTSTQIDGQGGVIKVKLNEVNPGFSGNAMIEAATTWNVTPGVKLSYANDKLQLFGSISGQYYNPRDNNSSIEKFYPSGSRSYTNVYDNGKKGYEFATVNMIYKPCQEGKLEAWLWQGVNAGGNDINKYSDDTEFLSNGYVKQNKTESRLTAGLKYTHNFEGWTLEAQADYSYNPASVNYRSVLLDSIAIENYKDNNRPHALASFAKAKIKLIPETPKQKCELTIGTNFKYTPKTYSFEDEVFRTVAKLNVNTNSIYVSPYVEINSTIGPVFLKGGVRYQYIQYLIHMEGQDDYEKPMNKVTAFLNLGWQPALHHHISAILDKSIKRPDNQQIYPGRFYDPERGSFIKGNQNLLNEDIYTASIDYQYDFCDNGHTALAGAGLKYNHFSNVISGIEAIGDLPSYANTGKGDKLVLNLMGMYGYGAFKLFLTGNLMQNWYDTGTTKDESLNYNITVTPILTFPQGDWRINGRFQYSSPVKSSVSELGQYFYSEVRLSKGFRKWTFHMKLTDNFHRLVTDYSYTSDGSLTMNSHYVNFPGFGLGASIRF